MCLHARIASQGELAMLFSNEKIKELSFKIKQLIDSSPISELENNLHALIQGALPKMELVSREEFDIQAALLARTQQQLKQLEEKISQLEQADAAKK
ncbi:accessory factor UbiK family protein [Methylophilus sp. 3sh_L]|uniref:accessory factor UbiK family protein n=1 Tax=Methylophilus sp. 3sh_L TaxID=3377114 RepID=UPI00398F5DA6